MSTELVGLPARGESRELFVDGAAGRLEALLAMPPGQGALAGVCLACHPHPLYGGAMSNKVVHALAAAALKAGLAAMRFNFRGVGASQGTFDDARGETDDAVAVAGWLRTHFPGLPLVLSGFSFGAYVSLKAAAQVHPAAQVSISIPFGRYVDQAAPPTHPGCPWLAVHSVDDDVVSWAETRAELLRYQPPPTIVELDGAGHFYHGRIGELQDIVLPFLQQSLRP
ncbi:MAG: alpha/beta hydrolase [Nevskia sp.]|nr:alpha/beta hydrolase [Nevskia sp.]